MATLTNNEVKNILESHHTGMVILMPGSELDCPAEKLVGSFQQFQFGMNGCPRCMMYALRGLMEREPAFKKLIVDSLNTKFNP